MPNIREGKILGGTIVLKTFAIATALVLTMSGFAEAQTPRKGGTIRLTIADDGRGAVDPFRGDTGNGILGMTERAELLGGTLVTGNGADGGFLVTATLPVAP